MLETYLISYCAPVLAGLKSANLINCPLTEAMNEDIKRLSVQLKEKGISLRVLKTKQSSALLYVYRPTLLRAEWEKPGVLKFLTCHGYSSLDVESAIDELSSRLCTKDEFPHEIGLFLGYPLWDVVGFIENQGKNCKCTGCWKVYGNECEARELFRKFKKCRQVYEALFSQGKTIVQLAVCA